MKAINKLNAILTPAAFAPLAIALESAVSSDDKLAKGFSVVRGKSGEGDPHTIWIRNRAAVSFVDFLNKVDPSGSGLTGHDRKLLSAVYSAGADLATDHWGVGSIRITLGKSGIPSAAFNLRGVVSEDDDSEI